VTWRFPVLHMLFWHDGSATFFYYRTFFYKENILIPRDTNYTQFLQQCNYYRTWMACHNDFGYLL
jgi:hypothetical protein